MTPISRSTVGKPIDSGTVPPVRAATQRHARDSQTGAGDTLAADADVRAVVPVTQRDMPASAPFMVTVRPQAALVAQLIATHMGLPQTRTLRRAGAVDADMAYRRTEELRPVPASRRDRTV